MATHTERDILGEVLQLIEATLKVPADKVDIDANFETFGINSLIVMELMENIEKVFEVALTPALFSNVDTVRGLTELVEKLLRKGGAAAAPAAAPAPAPAATPLVAAAPRSASAQEPHRQLLDYIAGKYAVDLSYRDFDSVDDIVDTLVYRHGGTLMRYYGVADDGSAVMSAAPAKAAPLVAIVGISCRLPDAPDHRAFWDNLLARKNSMREIPTSRWDWQQHYAETVTPGKTVSKWGALIDHVDCFDAAFFGIPAAEAAAMDPQQRLLLQENYRAVEDAGLDMKKLAGSRTGVFVGYEYSEYEQYLRRLNNKDFTKGPLFSSSSPSYYLSNRLSHIFDFCGPSESFNVNCASSAVAINRAVSSLLAGESDIALASAVSLNLFEGDYIASSQYGILSPDGTSGVFDDDANGFTRGEGVAALVLKRLDDAERDNDRIYGVVRCSHQSFRGAARNISEVKHESIARVLQECYQRAGVDMDSVHYIEVDGYASKWADSFEYEGIKGAFEQAGNKAKHVALASVKGNIGNVESVSGIANVIKVALSLHHGKFPATTSMKKVNSFIDIANPAHPLYIADREIEFDTIRSEDGSPIRAGVNSFADSGANVHILLEEYRAAAPAAAAGEGKRLFVLSARDPARLSDYVQDYIDFLADARNADSFAELVYTAQTGREALAERLAIVAGSCQELADKLALVKKAGIKEKLGLESREIFHASVKAGEKNTLASLISPDMAMTQLAQSAQSAQWKQVALLWVNGVSIPWETLWRGHKPRKASLPAYPFARERHWIDIAVSGEAQAHIVADAVTVATPAANAAPAAWSELEQLYFYTPAEGAVRPADAMNVARLEKIELFLRYESARQLTLSLDEVALDKNFIELGMNSIGVADLIIKTDALLGANLSPSVLFKHPEIGTLSLYLSENYAEAIDALIVCKIAPAPEAVKQVAEKAAPVLREVTPADIVVPLQTKGERTPLFAVPGAGGSALSLQQLAQALGTRQPFYCLEAVGLDGGAAALPSVEAIAEFNIQALRTVQPNGPYRLAGYSNGGVVAFEMARRLVDEHGEIVSLALIDTLSPLQTGKDPVDEMVEVFKHFVSSLGGESNLTAEALRAVPEALRSGFLFDHLAGLGFELPREQFIATFNAATDNEKAVQAYAPTKLLGTVDALLLRASDSYAQAPADYGWDQLLVQPLRIVEIRSDHFSIVEKDAAVEVAKKLVQAPPRSNRKSAAKQELEVDAV